MSTRSRSLAPPLLIAFAGVALLIACIPIPVYRRSGGGPRPESQIGAAGSNKPLRLGRSTREDRLRHLGQPEVGAHDDGDSIVYPYGLATIFWFPCYQDYERHHLRVEFDERGTLRGYKAFKSMAKARRPLAKR
jgi:hypothetical protein